MNTRNQLTGSRWPALAGMILLVLTTDARAQHYDNPPVPIHIESFGYNSTAAEGYLTGWSRLLRGYGEGNYYNSLAAANYQRAWTLELENRQRRAAPYIARREQEVKARLVRTDRRRQDVLAREMEADLAANRTATDIDGQHGHLNWPNELRSPRYQRELYQISTCLGRWVENDHVLAAADRSLLKRSLGELSKRLGQEQLKESSVELAEARNLLDNISRAVFARQVAMPRLAGGPATDR